MSHQVAPSYHAVISPILVACLRGQDAPPAPPAAPRRARATAATRRVHMLRRDGARPFRFEGTFIASDHSRVVTVGEVAFRHTLDLYLDADSALIAHVVLEPEDDGAARPVYRVLEVHDEGDADRVLAAAGQLRADTQHTVSLENSTLSEGNSHVLSNAVA